VPLERQFGGAFVEKGKAFFFEKKKQKTFARLGWTRHKRGCCLGDFTA
jgi:hypothetical protein